MRSTRRRDRRRPAPRLAFDRLEDRLALTAVAEVGPAQAKAKAAATWRHVGPLAATIPLKPIEDARGIRYRPGSAAALLDVHTPEGTAPPGGWPVLLAIHGGGWYRGSRTVFGEYLSSMTLAGYLVVSVDYTLTAPGRPAWPENFRDVAAAVRWVRGNAGRLGADPGRVAAIGESAGGQLAALLGTADLGPRSKVDAVIAFHAPHDLVGLFGGGGLARERVVGMLGASFAADPARYQDASPIDQVSQDDAPMLLIHGTADSVVPVAQSRAMAGVLRREGVPHGLILVPNGGHEFRLRTRYRDLVPTIREFLDRSFARPDRASS